MPVMAVNNQNQQEPAGGYRSRPRWVGRQEDGGGAAAVARRTAGGAVVRARGGGASGLSPLRPLDFAACEPETVQGPLLGGAQLDKHRIARARAEGVDKSEERFAGESLRVIPDEQ
jgi:hypothetical protein